MTTTTPLRIAVALLSFIVLAPAFRLIILGHRKLGEKSPVVRRKRGWEK